MNISFKHFKTIFAPTGFIFLFVISSGLILFALIIDGILDFPYFVSEPWNILLSVLFLWAGLFLVLWSLLVFLKANGASLASSPPSALITDGPYAYSRNPMLTGVFFLSFGFGIISKSVFLTFVFTPAFILFMIFVLRRIEEPELSKRFGEAYLKYKAEVPMLLPKISIPEIPGLKIPTLKIKFPKLPFSFGKKPHEPKGPE